MSTSETNDTYLYRRSCKGKQNHADPIHALVECMRVYRTYGASMNIYKCHFCTNYHLGHVHQRVREFIADLVGPKETLRLTYSIADALTNARVKALRPRSGNEP